MTTTVDKIEGEIAADLMEDIIKTLPKIQAINSPDHSILIHGMGAQPRSFYNEIKHNKSVELLWTGWCSNTWWTYVVSLLPGQAGLIKVLNRQQLDDLYLDIGTHSMCGLYFIPNDKIASVIEKVKKERTPDISDIMTNEKNFFLMTVDFDFHGGDKDGEIYYRHIIMGNSLDASIKNILKNK